jgi:hypothetical protein
VAQTLTVGRADGGYPDVTVPSSTAAVVTAAVNAGILHLDSFGVVTIGMLQWRSNMSSFTGQPVSWIDDYDAWRKAIDYASRQSVSKLKIR